jgi:hypothetical protein
MAPWKYAGRTGVDAGIIIITDPCYVVRNSNENKYQPFNSYDEMLEDLQRQEQKAGVPDGHTLDSYQMTNEWHADIGVVIGHFGGDGVFPIYIEHDPETGQVVAAQIRFDGEEP